VHGSHPQYWSTYLLLKRLHGLHRQITHIKIRDT
jgi:hypothetical protein